MSRQFAATPSSCGSSASASRARNLMFAQSTANCFSRPSLWILTTTSSPFRSRARCTWAREAAASGTRSNDSNGNPSSSDSTMATARSVAKPGTSFCRLTNSEITSRGSASTRVDSSWPNFMKVGPSLSSVSRNSPASARRASTSASFCSFDRRSRDHFSAKFAAHAHIAPLRRTAHTHRSFPRQPRATRAIAADTRSAPPNSPPSRRDSGTDGSRRADSTASFATGGPRSAPRLAGSTTSPCVAG
mmetsp:Transcript_8545/g.26739  ORF Transcript_8545/g.26739 Transcript_8545/m.26739 type:complete len:246 (-) Transcript_8545:80-817(-)